MKMGRLLLFVFLFYFSGISVFAAFTDGIETFDGTTLDSNTWTTLDLGVNTSVSQNNALRLSGNIYYTTKQALVSKDDVVSIQLAQSTNPWTNGYMYFSGWLLSDKPVEQLWTEGGFSAGIEYTDREDGNYDEFVAYFGGSGTNTTFGQSLDVYTKPFRMEMQFKTITWYYSMILYSAYDSNGDCIFSYSEDVSEIPDNFYISLYSNGGGSVTFDNVQIIPEPTTFCLFALGAAFVRRKRR